MMASTLDRYQQELAALLSHVRSIAGAQARWKDVDLVLRHALPAALRVHDVPFCRAVQRRDLPACLEHCRPDQAWWRQRDFGAHWRRCHAGVIEYTCAGRTEDGTFLGTASIGPFTDPALPPPGNRHQPPPAQHAQVMAAARLFLDGLRWLAPLRADAQVGVRQLDSGPPTLRAALDLLRREPRRDLSLERVARAVALSPTRLTHLCQSLTGRSFSAWRQEAVTAHARHLLVTTDLPIGVIAERCGYGNPTHFAAAFRREVGVGPLAFRQRHAQAGEV